MTVLQDELSITLERTQGAQHDAARIWARATAVRDGRPDRLDAIGPALDGIRSRLALPDASLHLARRAGVAVGFALLVPRGGTLEITYLAVDPSHWGEDVATHLLDNVEEHARLLRFGTIDLWVIADNTRAIARYERASFGLTTDVQDAAGRLERRMEYTLY